MTDWNNHLPWSDLALDDLRRSLPPDRPVTEEDIGEVADFLCRSPDLVKAKALELGLISPSDPAAGGATQ